MQVSGDFKKNNHQMEGLSLNQLISSATDKVSSKAKDSLISTLSDPEFKNTVNVFTKQWFDTHSHIIYPTIASLTIFSLMGGANILLNFFGGKSPATARNPKKGNLTRRQQKRIKKLWTQHEEEEKASRR